MIATSHRTTSIKNAKGFTLFEILIVISILAGIMAVLVPRLNRGESQVKKVTRHLLVLSRDVRTQARLKNRTFRIVFNMKNPDHSYWVESTPGAVPPKTLEQLEEDERLDEEVRPKVAFEKETKFTKTEYKLGKDLFFGSVETNNSKRPVTEGEAYVYYSPQGLVEASAIQLTNRKQLNWTLVINSLTGQVDIVDHALALKDTKLE